MLAELYVLSGRDAGKVLDAGLLAGPTLFVGRAATNQLRIKDPQASRVHCRIDVTTDGLTIEDAGSGNGTFLNGERLLARRPLRDGDEIRIGVTRCRVLLESPEEERLWRDSRPAEDESPSEESTLEVSSARLTPVVSDASGSGVHATAGAEPTPRAGAARPARPRKLREVLPGYRLEARLGGHSRRGIAVYRAIQVSLDRPVAVKVFLPRGETRKEDVERFLREARAVARLPHPHIVTTHDVLRRGKMHAIVMEYLPGGSLADRLADGRPLPLGEALALVTPLAAALEHLHRHGVVHRGVKPSNVLLGGEAGGAKLAGFGFATGPRGERSGDTCFLDAPLEGFAYLAPEQLAGEATIDPRADVYGLGATLHAALSGGPPFGGEGLATLASEVLRAPPPPLPSEHGAVADVVARCLAKAPAERFADVTALRAALAEPGA